jgi:hypothetical protein
MHAFLGSHVAFSSQVKYETFFFFFEGAFYFLLFFFILFIPKYMFISFHVIFEWIVF